MERNNRYKLLKSVLLMLVCLMTMTFRSMVSSGAEAASPIRIKTAEQLKKIGSDSAYPMDGNYVLDADIDLSGEKWIPIGGRGTTDWKNNYIGVRGCDDPSYANVFSGTFDGNGHVISGMTIEAEGSVSGQTRNCAQMGLFSIVASNNPARYASVENLILKDVSINVDFSDGFAAIGSLAGEVNGYSKIDNISVVNGSIIANPTAACDTVGIGGVIGECRTASSIGNGKISITNIYNGVSVTASGQRHDYLYAAGIVGRVAKTKLGKISGCINTGIILYDGFLVYPVLSPELGNITYLNNISACYFLEDTAECFGSESNKLTNSLIKNGFVPEKLDSSIWKTEKGCYPAPKICYESSAADILYFSGLDLGFAEGENAKNVKSTIMLPQKSGNSSLTWKSDNEKVLYIEADKAKADTSRIGTDVIVTLTATSSSGYTKSFKLRVIPDVYINAEFSSDYAQVGKEIRVIIENAMNYSFSYEWKVDGKTVVSTTDSYTPVKEDLESFISVNVKAEGTDMEWNLTTYLSELPVVYIDTDDGKAITSNYTAKNADIRVQGNEEFHDTAGLYTGRTTIKGRGNSTWFEAVSMGVKKPYKLKLDKKCNLLGISEGGKNKHWVLLANMIDHTNMRNEITYNFSKDMGLDCAMASTGVVLILNGEYEGMYQLCEHVRVASSRVNVFEWEALAEELAAGICAKNLYLDITSLEDYLKSDLSFITSGIVKYSGKEYKVTDYYKGIIPDITGGYLLGMDFRSPNDTNKYPSSFITSNTIPMYIDVPEAAKTCPEMMEYVENYINAFEASIKGTDHIVDYDGKDMHYSDLFDLDSLVSYWFVCEITNNWDSMKNSTYMYKDIDGKVYMGPAWDYDWGYGNICMYNCGNLCVTDMWHTQLSGTNAYEGGFAESDYQKYQWNRYLVKDPYFVKKLYDKYKETRATVFEELIKEGGIIDTYHDKYRTASEANDEKWSFSYSNYSGYAFVNGVKKKVTSQLYEPAFQSFKTFVKKRIEWFDSQFVSLEKLYTSLGGKISDQTGVSVEIKADGICKVSVETESKNAEFAEIMVNGRRIEFADGEYMYPLTDGKCSVSVPSWYFESGNTENIVEAKVFESTYKIADSKASYAVFEYEKPLTETPAPTKTPRPSGVPAVTRYPVATDTPKPTRTPRVTQTPKVTETAKPQTPYINQADTVQTDGKKDEASQATVKKSIAVAGKKSVKRGKTLVLTARLKGLSGKVKWTISKKGKKYIRIKKLSGKKVTLLAKNKKGKTKISVSCKKIKKTVTIKVY